MDTLNTDILMGTTERAASFRGIGLPGEIARNVAGIEYAKALGALAASSGERNHRPSCLWIEGIEESRCPCIRKSGRYSTAPDNHGCYFQLNAARLHCAVLRKPLSRVPHCCCSMGYYHGPER